jgi:phosphonate transport system permease protein
MSQRSIPILAGILLLLVALSFADELPSVVEGIPFALDYAAGMYPPDWSILPGLIGPIGETVRMAVLGVGLSAILAAPLSFLAARDTTPCPAIYLVARGFINLARGMPTLLWAILFVSMVGLGPPAGVFAMTLHCIGALGKLFSEAIESMAARLANVLEAMSLDGANSPQAIWHGLVPSVEPLFASYVIYYFEWAVRVGTILGLVGAGGLGLRLTMSIRLFKRHETLTIILVILAAVTVIDSVSRLVRKRLVEMSV